MINAGGAKVALSMGSRLKLVRKGGAWMADHNAVLAAAGRWFDVRGKETRIML